jgi:VIT1/CCC1 family predicted Fe2+/Mn2+ transporter
MAVRPDTGLSESHQEKVEVAAIVKMLIAGLLVFAVVFIVGYLLKSQFQGL